MHYQTNAQYYTGPASGNKGRLLCCLAGRSALTELAIVHWVGCINAIKGHFYITGNCPQLRIVELYYCQCVLDSASFWSYCSRIATQESYFYFLCFHFNRVNSANPFILALNEIFDIFVRRERCLKYGR